MMKSIVSWSKENLNKLEYCTFPVIFIYLALVILIFWIAHSFHNVVENPKLDLYNSISSNYNLTVEEIENLDHTLTRASLVLENGRATVIVAPVNGAWVVEGSLLDNFLESFETGDGISYLVEHIVIVGMDAAAYNRCTEVHKNCFHLKTEGTDFSAEKVFMTEDYLRMTHRKTWLQSVVLELGFDLIFSDIDIVWFRAPFQHFSRDADLELACDGFNGNSDDPGNGPNTGFFHATSNPRTISLFKRWREFNKDHPGQHDQDVFNIMRGSPGFQEIGAKVKFMPTLYFSGFCQKSNDLEKVCTMHANCCGRGGAAKLADLKLTIEDWKNFRSMTPQESRERNVQFRAPQNC